MSFQETEYQAELYGRAYAEKPMIMGFIKNSQEIKCTMQGTLQIAGVGIIANTVDGPAPVTGQASINGLAFTITLTELVPIVTTDSGQKAEDGSIYVYPHSHVFRNLPLTLTPTYEGMRGSASGIDGGSPMEASKISNGLTCPEVKGTTKEGNTGLNNQLKAKEFTPIEV
jgi:hypothetical protein